MPVMLFSTVSIHIQTKKKTFPFSVFCYYTTFAVSMFVCFSSHKKPRNIQQQQLEKEMRGNFHITDRKKNNKKLIENIKKNF